MIKTAIFQALKEHALVFKSLQLRDLFQDTNRFAQFSLEVEHLFLDYSKNYLTPETLSLLLKLADSCQLSQQIESLFKGDKVNSTENRPALHTALRDSSPNPLYVDGIDIKPAISQTLEQMKQIVTQLQQGTWLGAGGAPVTDVVNLGIGGSDLGPAMVTRALTPYQTGQPQCHFVSNVDAAHIFEVLKKLQPETTLFIVASKSFTTQETLCNAETAKKWLLKAGIPGQELARHFIAVTACPEKATQWGIKTILPIWQWVGGRFSLWSAIGLSIAIAIGMENYNALLEGAHAMDLHFRHAELSQNMPVIMGLIAIWYINFFQSSSYAILPYSQYLHMLPNYLQQAEMESNGKDRCHDGSFVSYATSPVIWGMVGCNGQHAIHQLFHQGTQLIPIDFILPLRSYHEIDEHHPLLVANCLSQSKALMWGQTEEEVRLELLAQGLSGEQLQKILPHKILSGNRPSNMLLLPDLTPHSLGAMLALYEHKIYVQSVIWNINCFDQWGVELGKQFSTEIFNHLVDDQQQVAHDCSTSGLISYYKNRRG